MRFRIASAITVLIAALSASACSKPTALASEANAKGRITAAAAPAQTAAPEVPPELLLDAPPADPNAPVDPNAIVPLGRAVTVSDYRDSVSGDISALPPVSDPAALAVAFADWRSRAAASPGAMEAGAIPLGADPQEYRPSDAELVAAEAGDRLAAALSGADEATRAGVSTTLGGDPSYKRFDYRVVDVMGSGRYFYASSPKVASLPL
jgi:hypothetical protein